MDGGLQLKYYYSPGSQHTPINLSPYRIKPPLSEMNIIKQIKGQVHKDWRDTKQKIQVEMYTT